MAITKPRDWDGKPVGVRYKFDDFLASAESFEKYLRQYKSRKISKKERIRLNCVLAEIIELL
jgi:hypothetical protein